MNPNMRNEKLRGVFEGLGFRNVQTVISSGNVVFETNARDVGALEARIEKAWPAQLGFRSTTIIRTARADSRPRRQESLRQSRGHTSDESSGDVSEARAEGEPRGPVHRRFWRLHHRGLPRPGRLFRCRPVRIADARSDAAALEKMLGKEITTRTWKTVHRILRKLS